jgi:hypothetical protein
MKMNLNMQDYKGIPLQLINRADYHIKQAKRFAINQSNQNVWIPNKHLEADGTIRQGENLEYIFASAQRQLELAGIMMMYVPIPREVEFYGRQEQGFIS